MIQVVDEKQMRRNSDGAIVDFIKIMIVGKPNQSIDSLKEEYKEYIPNYLLNKKSNSSIPVNQELPVFTFWRKK